MGDRQLNSAASEFKPMQQLVERVRAYRFQIKDLPREAMQGYPVPVVRKNSVVLAFPFFLQRGLPPRAPEVFAPGWIVFIDARSGNDIEVERRQVNLEKPLGIHQLPPGLSYADLQDKQRRLYALLDELLPMVGKYPKPVPSSMAAKVAEFRGLWLLIAQKPLFPEYYSLNGEWFDLLGIQLDATIHG
jgi:hypothetical protein